MNLLSVDPGTKTLGLAYFKNGKLIKSFPVYTQIRDKQKLSTIEWLIESLSVYHKDSIKPEIIVYERPQFARGVGEGNLFMHIGELIAELRKLFPNAKFEPIPVFRWQGYFGVTNKYSGEDRKRRVQFVLKHIPELKDHVKIGMDYNESDAIGIGWFFLQNQVDGKLPKLNKRSHKSNRNGWANKIKRMKARKVCQTNSEIK
jgi:hypothetical protein